MNVYISLGSNLGDRRENLQNALFSLKSLAVDARISVSRIFETEPWGNEQQPLFLNCVARFDTDLEPEKLLERLKSIELELGRESSDIVWGPRKIDLDIILYGDLVYRSERLQIPHARMHERCFVLVPLHDLEPDLLLPHIGKRVCEVLEEIGGCGEMINSWGDTGV